MPDPLLFGKSETRYGASGFRPCCALWKAWTKEGFGVWVR
jgi:hypothetical protein